MMKLKEISKDIYDVSALLDEELGAMGTPERQKNTDKAWKEYNAQILNDSLTHRQGTERTGSPSGRILHKAGCVHGLIIKGTVSYI